MTLNDLVNTNGFKWLYGYARVVGRRYAALLQGDELCALAAEAAVLAHRRWDPQRGAFSTYARRHVLRAIHHQGRALERERAHISLVESQEAEGTAADRSGEAEVRLARMLGVLTETERDLVIRFYQHGESYAEVAEALGIGKATAHRWLMRARAKMLAVDGSRESSGWE